MINRHPEGEIGVLDALSSVSSFLYEKHLDEKMSTLSEACLYDWDVERMVMWLREVSLNLAGG